MGAPLHIAPHKTKTRHSEFSHCVNNVLVKKISIYCVKSEYDDEEMSGKKPDTATEQNPFNMDVECLLFEAKIRFVPRTKHVEDLRPVVKEAILLEYSHGILLALHDCNYELHQHNVKRERDLIHRQITAIENHRGEGEERARHAERFISVFRRNERLEHHPDWPRRYYEDFFTRLQRQAKAFRRCKWHISPALNRALHAIQRKEATAAKRERMMEDREDLILRNEEDSYRDCQYLRVLKFFGMAAEEAKYVDSEKVMANYIETIHSLAREQRKSEDERRNQADRRRRDERQRKEKENSAVNLNSKPPKTAKRRTPEPAKHDPLLKKARQALDNLHNRRPTAPKTPEVRKSTAPIRLQRPALPKAQISPRQRARDAPQPTSIVKPAAKPTIVTPAAQNPAEKYPSYLVLPDERLENKIAQIRPTTLAPKSNHGIRLFPSDMHINAWDRFFIRTKEMKDNPALQIAVPRAIKFVYKRTTWTDNTVDLVAIDDNDAYLIRRIINVYGRHREEEDGLLREALPFELPPEEDPAILERAIVELQNDSEFTLIGKPKGTRVTVPLTAQQRAEKEELAIDVELANLSIVDEMEVGAEEEVITSEEARPADDEHIDDVLLLHHSFDFGEQEDNEAAAQENPADASMLSLTTRHLESTDSAIGVSTASTNPFAAGAEEEAYWETVTTVDWRQIAVARSQGNEKAIQLIQLLKEMNQ